MCLNDTALNGIVHDDRPMLSRQTGVCGWDDNIM